MSLRARTTVLLTAAAVFATTFVPATAASAAECPPGIVSIGQAATGISGTASGWPVGTTYAFSWFRGATGSTATTAAAGTATTPTASSTLYTPVASDANQFLRVEAVATAPGCAPATVSSEAADYSMRAYGMYGVYNQQSWTVGREPFTEHAPLWYKPNEGAERRDLQWLRDGEPIPGATTDRYTLSDPDVGHKLSVRYTYWRDGWVPWSFVTDESPMIEGGQIGLNGRPKVVITPEGFLASPDSTFVSLAGVSFAYQWYRAGFEIPGATNALYLPVAADAGALLNVSVTVSKYGYTPNFAWSHGDEPSIYTSGDTPVITGGTPIVDLPLSVSESSYVTGTGGPLTVTRSYQWFRQTGSATPVAIEGATSREYTPVGADFGTKLTAQVTVSSPPYLSLTQTTPSTVPVTVGVFAGSYAPPAVSAAGTWGSAASPLTLTATRVPGDITDSGASFAYQWMRGSTAITGATKTTYRPTTADLNAELWVRATVTARGYTTMVLESDRVNYTLATADALTVTGTPSFARTLAIAPLDFGSVPTTTTYQWLRNGAAISGAKSATYKLVAADIGKKISVKIVVTSPGRVPYVATSPATASVAKGGFDGVLEPVVTLTGPQILRATFVPLTTQAGKITYAYQWQRNGVAIKGATKSTYKLVSSDAGAQIRVRIVASQANYATVAQFSPTANYTVTASTARPVITGVVELGGVLTAAPQTYSVEGVGAVSPTPTYVWYRSGTAIKGATAASYTLTNADLGKNITVRVIARHGDYLPYAVTSAGTQKVGKLALADWDAAAPPVVQAPGTLKLTITGTGVTTPGTTVAYQWLRNGSPISKATKSSYTMVSADSGKLISVRVTTSKSGYTTAVATTPGTNYTLRLDEAGALVADAPEWRVGATASLDGDAYADAAGDPVTSVTKSYQWLRNGKVIKGATKSTYTAVAADYGTTTTLRLTVTSPGFVGFTRIVGGAGTALKVVPGVFESSNGFEVPQVSKSGRTLTAYLESGTVLNPGVTYLYQWMRDGSPIAGATKASYTLVAADSSRVVSVTMTAKKSYFATKPLGESTRTNYTMTTGSTPAIFNSTPPHDVPHVGDVLTFSPPSFQSPTYAPAGAISFTYQWKRDGVAIKGGTTSSYTVTAADKGKRISLSFVATSAEWAPFPYTTEATEKVLP